MSEAFRHAAHSARAFRLAQGLCALALIAGCARAPVASSGADVRARFLERFGRAEPATRGAGMLSIRHGDRGRTGLNTRWGAVGESLAVIAYSGPVRVLDATVPGDSVYVALRPYDLGLAGPIPRGAALGGRGLRFLARPWDFSAPWVRQALERALVEPVEDGWRLSGTLRPSGDALEFALLVNERAEPRELRLREAGGPTVALIRYGGIRRYDLGRFPRSVEWIRAATRIRLEIDEQARARPTPLWHAPPPGGDWTILALDDPRGRDLLRRLLGVGGEEVEP